MAFLGKSHYDWLSEHLKEFFTNFGLEVCGDISAHGDKCYLYREDWKAVGIPFPHGVAIYLLTYRHPFSKTVRETVNGWIDAKQWVIDNYKVFKDYLPPVGEEYR